MSATTTTESNVLFDTVRDLLSVLEPLLIYHRFWPGTYIEGEAFRRRILYWREPSIDAILLGLIAHRS